MREAWKEKVADKPFFPPQQNFLWAQGRIVLWVAFLDRLQSALYFDDRDTVHVHNIAMGEC